MCHKNDGLSFLIQFDKNIHNLETCLAVEIAGGFIAEQNLRVIDQCPGNCDPLLLTPGKLIGAVSSSSPRRTLRI